MFRHSKLHVQLFHVLAVVAILFSTMAVRGPVHADADPCADASATGCSFGLPTFQYQLLLSDMLAHPEPNVRQLQVDTNELNKFAFYKLIGGVTPLFNAPGGSQVDSISAGFNFVTPLAAQGDFVEIEPGKWTQTKYLAPAHASEYAGVLIDQPLAYPMAWVLLPTKPSAIPGQQADPNTPIVERYTRVNIYATKHVGDWDWYLVGPGQWLEQRRIARVLPTPKPDGAKGRWVAVDLYEQVLVAYQDDQMVFATLISSGLPKWDTNLGLFRIWTRATATAMSGAMGRPDFYYLQAVPWVMYFDHDISLHGTYWHDGFGYRHSHGCVNMSITDAHWMFDWTSGFFADASVYVWTSGQY